ncbi:MAG: ISLre2 family transposase [Treponema sp.]|uniref:ISLre2 family transposase n=1 Tax=Treponema sp. TaxID=166 RepID=UPI002A483A63|nr:ISLre2 family transposase [Treponema sp.]
MNILTENKENIKSLEKKFYDYACKLAVKAFKNWLQELDRELMKSRDKELFRHKGHRKTCIKTLMGEVEYSRAVYQVMDNECEKKFVYLLDEYVGFENIGFVSANLVERIADNICETSYAETAKNISSLTGQSISRQGVWNVVQKLGSQIERQENRYIELNEKHQLQGEKEIAVLFEEADGVFVRKQKRYRHKGNNSFELKVAIAHEGWRETAPKRFELAGKTVVCDIASGTAFNKRKEAVLASKYNLDEINTRIFNSDGGLWIKKLHDYNDEVHFQLDPFHIQKAIRSSDIGGDYLKQVTGMLRESKIDEMFEYLDAVANSVETENAEEKVRSLISYLKSNREGLIPYQKRGLELPKLPEGLVYKGMGNAEHNMYLAVAKRMKHQSASWSPQGGLKLCKLICQKISNTLSETIENLTTFEIPEHLKGNALKPLLSAAKAPKKDGKGYEGKHTAMPFVGCAVSNGRKEIMNWLKGRNPISYF